MHFIALASEILGAYFWRGLSLKFYGIYDCFLCEYAVSAFFSVIAADPRESSRSPLLHGRPAKSAADCYEPMASRGW